MKQAYLRALYRGALEQKGYLPLTDKAGEALPFRPDANTVWQRTAGGDQLLQMIDGDAFPQERARGLLQNNADVLKKLAGSGGSHAIVEVFVFETAPDGEYEELLRQAQSHDAVRKSFLRCIVVELAERRPRRLYTAPFGWFGLGGLLKAAFDAPDGPAPDPAELTRRLRRGEEELKPRFRVRTPVVTYVLLGVNLLIFAALELYAMHKGVSYDSLLSVFGEKENGKILNGEWWRLITAMFLHGGLVHVAVNCWSLYVVGIWVERMFGHGRYAAIYLVAGVMGNLSSLAFSLSPSVGASGAIFGLMGALLWLGLERPQFFRVYFGAGVLATVAVNLVYSFTSTGIDAFAHLGGLLGGFLAAGAAFPAVGDEKIRLPRAALAAATVAAAVALGAAGWLMPDNRVYAAAERMETLLEEKQPAQAMRVGRAAAFLPARKNVRAWLYGELCQAALDEKNIDAAYAYASEMKTYSEPDGLYAMAVVDYSRGHYADARQELVQLQKISPNYSGLSALLADVEKALGN